MKSLLAILLLLAPLKLSLADSTTDPQSKTILPNSLPQKVYSRYQTNFTYRHDRGFYLGATIGPQWNHSIKDPVAKAVRFGGKLALGWYLADGIALYAGGWGHFLEEASLVAGGPGVLFLFDGPNIGVDFTFGIGRAFSLISAGDETDFAETVLAANLSLAKYWWISGNNCLGVSLSTSAYGFTLSSANLGTVGWSGGLGLSYLFG